MAAIHFISLCPRKSRQWPESRHLTCSATPCACACTLSTSRCRSGGPRRGGDGGEVLGLQHCCPGACMIPFHPYEEGMSPLFQFLPKLYRTFKINEYCQNIGFGCQALSADGSRDVCLCGAIDFSSPAPLKSSANKVLSLIHMRQSQKSSRIFIPSLMNWRFKLRKIFFLFLSLFFYLERAEG